MGCPPLRIAALRPGAAAIDYARVRRRTQAWSARVLGAMIAFATVAQAQASESLFLGASLETQALVRTPDPNTLQFIQQRNTLRLLADWQLIKDGSWQGPFSPWREPPLVNGAAFFLLYRGVYDSIYDIDPSLPTRRDYRGVAVQPPSNNLDELSSGRRNALEYENRLREAYLDLQLDHEVLVRLGRQQIVWGVSDGFRLLDRVNSLDTTWHQLQALPPTDESFDEIRVPAWMLLVRKNGLPLDKIPVLRALQDKGSFAEVYWNPGDWNPNKVGFLPTPWGTMLANPLLDPATGQQAALQNGTRLFRQGDYHRNPGDNSQVGVRIGTDREICCHLTDCPLQGNLVYMYHRFTPWGGASTSAASLFQGSTSALSPGELPLEFDAPYIHTAGLSLSYASMRRQIKYPIPPGDLWRWGARLESTVDFGVPYYFYGNGWTPAPTGSVPPNPQHLVPPTRTRDIWSGVVGVDILNSRCSRIVNSFQVFWTYLLQDDGRTLGSLDLPNFFPGQPATGLQDDVRRWEVLLTWVPTVDFDGGRLRLSGAYLLDWVNSYSQEAAWAVRYTITPGLVAEVSQRFLINPEHEVNYEPWGLAGLNRGRSETGLRLRYEIPTGVY